MSEEDEKVGRRLVQLIRQVNTEADRDEYVTIFFQIGQMGQVRNDLMEVLNHRDGPYYGRALYTYNGVNLYLQVREIPQVLALLVRSGFQVYSVYEVYEP